MAGARGGGESESEHCFGGAAARQLVSNKAEPDVSVAAADPDARGLSAGRVLGVDEKAGKAPLPLSATPETAWRALGWFGLLIALVALVDLVLNAYPLAFGSPEWEFSVVSGTMASLPLFSIGLAGMLGSQLARGRRIGIWVVSVLLLVFAVLIGAGCTMFALDVPLALKATAGGPAALVIKKTIVRTAVMGIGFGGGYLIAAVASIRHVTRRRMP